MWEVKAAEGRLDELVAFVLDRAESTAKVYRSRDGRVVVIDPTDVGVQGVPDDLVARSPHVWAFDEVHRS